MKLTIRFGEADVEQVGDALRIRAVEGDFPDPVVFAASFGKTMGFHPAVQCTVEFEPGEAGTHVLAASLRDHNGRPCGAEQRKEFTPPEYGVFPFMFWWPNASLPPGEYLVHVSLDGEQIETRTLRVLPYEQRPDLQ